MITNNVYAIPARRPTQDLDLMVDHVFYPFDGTGLEFPCFYIRIVNNTNVDFYISYDGATLHDFIPQATSLAINFQINSQLPCNQANKAENSLVYVYATAFPLIPEGEIVLTGYTSYR